MKVLIIYPRFIRFLENNPELREIMGNPITAFYKGSPSLGAPIVAAITKQMGHEVVFIDENLEEVPYDEHFDLVAVNCFTPQATFAYAICDRFRERGITTVIGGIHPTSIPEEAARHADVVSVGEAEITWPKILKDARRNRLKPLYKAEGTLNPNMYLIPDRSIYENKIGYDWDVFFLQTQRGCNFNCSCCSLPVAHGTEMRFRPIEHVLKELDTVKSKQVFLTEDTVILKSPRIKEHNMALFKAMKGIHDNIILNTSMIIDDDPEFLRTVREAGVSKLYLVTGFDPISRQAITYNNSSKADEVMARLNDAGFEICISVMVGDDDDDASVFDRSLDFLDRNNITIGEFYINTPYPGSQFYNQVVRENRLLTRDYTLYNSSHVVFQPKKMTVDELQNGFLYLWEEHFRKHPMDPQRSAEYFQTTEKYQNEFNLVMNK